MTTVKCQDEGMVAENKAKFVFLRISGIREKDNFRQTHII
jgi:hypothetical protein